MYILEYDDETRPLDEWLERVSVVINDLLEDPKESDLDDIHQDYQINYSVRVYEVLMRNAEAEELTPCDFEAAKLPAIPLREIIGGSMKWEHEPDKIDVKMIAFLNRATSMDWLRLEIRRACMELYVEHGDFKHFHNLIAHLIWNLKAWISPRSLIRLCWKRGVGVKWLSECIQECANEVGQLGKYNFPVMLTLDEYWNTFGVGCHRFNIPFLIPTEDGYQRTYSQLMIDRHMRNGSFDKVMRGD